MSLQALPLHGASPESGAGNGAGSDVGNAVEPLAEPRRRGRPRGAGTRVAKPPLDLETRKRGALVLEVLAGLRTPSAAAEELGVSLARFYLLEQRAVDGLVQALVPRERGPTRSLERECEKLRGEIRRLEREQLRTQALLRLAQRASGIASPPAAAKKEPPAPAAPGGKRPRRRRRPAARALKALRRLRAEGDDVAAVDLVAPSTPEDNASGD